MLRLFLPLLLSLALIGSATPSLAAIAPNCGMPEMANVMEMPADHRDGRGEGECCTFECGISCHPAAFLDHQIEAPDAWLANSGPRVATEGMFDPIAPDGVDPPPRHSIT